MFDFLKKNPTYEDKIAQLEERVSALEKKNKKLTEAIGELSKVETISEPKKKSQELNPNKQANKKAKEKYIRIVMEQTGLDFEQADTLIADAKKRIGITYKDFANYKFANIPAEKQEEEYQRILDKRAKKQQELKEHREATISAVMKITGWDEATTAAKIDEARKRTGCAYKEYLVYKFYELDEKTQNELFLMKMSNALTNKYCVSKKYNRMFCDKELTNEHFSKYLKRPWCVNTKISFAEFKKKFNNTRIIYKPLDGNRGIGVQGYELNDENIQAVYDELMKFPSGVVEEYVVQHPEMSKLAPSSVNTIRVVTISDYKKPVTPDGKHMDIAYTALRIGGGSSIVDNFHSGGMCAAIDMETGTLVTDAADMQGNVFEYHPVTGVKIKGFQIPRFQEVLDMVTEACNEHKISGYLGWDIAVTEKGPVLIEINLRPGVVLLTTPYISERKGMKYVMERYL